MLSEAVGLLEIAVEAVAEPEPLWPLKDASGELLTLCRTLSDTRGELEDVFSGLRVIRGVSES